MPIRLDTDCLHVRKSSNSFVFDYNKLLDNNITKDYKKVDENIVADIAKDDKNIAAKLDIEDRLFCTKKRDAFITL